VVLGLYPTLGPVPYVTERTMAAMGLLGQPRRTSENLLSTHFVNKGKKKSKDRGLEKKWGTARLYPARCLSGRTTSTGQ
jgi:hypothetical protein